MARPKSDRTLLLTAIDGVRSACEQIEGTFGDLPDTAKLLQHELYWELRNAIPDRVDRYTAEQREAAAAELSEAAYLMRVDRDAVFSPESTGYGVGQFLTVAPAYSAWSAIVDERDLDQWEPAQAEACADALDEAAAWVLSGWSPGDEWTELDIDFFDLADRIDERSLAAHTADLQRLDPATDAASRGALIQLAPSLTEPEPQAAPSTTREDPEPAWDGPLSTGDDGEEPSEPDPEPTASVNDDGGPVAEDALAHVDPTVSLDDLADDSSPSAWGYA